MKLNMSLKHSLRYYNPQNIPGFFKGWIALVILLLTVPEASGQIRDGGIDPWNLGKGDWIYFMSDATNKLGGNVPSVTNETSLMLYYKSQGIRYIIVKAATSASLFNGTYSVPQFTSNLVNFAHANGVLIFGYNRSYGSNITAEIAISDYVFNQGADGFVFDAESEWESGSSWIGTNGPSKAWQLCSTVRSNWPTKFLAHSPFPIISFHSSFPYKEFGYWCDAVMPQIYSSGWANVNASPSGGIDWSDANWYSWQNSLVGKSTNINGVTYYWTNAIKPLAPIQNVYGPATGQSLAGGSASALPNKDVMEFIDYLSCDPNAVTKGGYKGASFFRSDLHGPVEWANIKAGTLGAFSNVVNNLVIDNPNATTSGAWTAVRTYSNGSYFGATGTDTNSFGTNYLTKAKGTGSAYVQFTPNVAVAGDYDVYQWHPYRADASASVPFVINYNGGSTTVYANQQTNSGNWTLLGRFNFTAGTAGFVRVTDGIQETGDVAMADALKMAYVVPVSSPVISGGIATNISDTAATITWTTDEASDSVVDYGTTTNYTSEITNAALVFTHSIGLSNLIATTNYHFVVKSTASGAPQTVSGDFTFATLPTGVTGSLILDNTNATVVGTWNTGTSSPDKYGPDYRYKSGGTGTAYLQYTPNIVAGAFYRVYEWHPQGSNRTTNAPYVINYNGGSQTIGINQQVNGGQWNLLGTFNFAAGSSGNVQVADTVSDTNHIVLADAIQFAYAAPVPIPIFNVSASPRQNSAIITWTTLSNATSQVLYGLTTNYDHATALDATPLIHHMVWLTGLSSNTTYFYRVVSQVGSDQFASVDYSFVTDPSVIVQSMQATYTGVWTIGSSAPDKYSLSYKYASTSVGGNTAAALFQPAITLPGLYDIYVWYSAGSNRSTNAPVTVGYPGGSISTILDMTVNGGSWQLLASGQYLPVGANTYVRVGNGAGESNKVAIADAARWTYSAGQDASFAGNVPAWWSAYYFGTSIDASQDPDGDGYNTSAEYVWGTDPTAGNSALNLRAQILAGGGLAVVFSPYQAGRIYQLQECASLAGNGHWVTLTNLPMTVNTNGQGVFTITNLSGAQKFLRLSVQLAP